MATPRKQRKSLRKWTPVEVYWVDIYSVYGDLQTEHFDDYRECVRKSMGYVQVDAADRLVIVHTDDRSAVNDTNGGDALVIPRGVVKKVINLSAKNKPTK